MGSEKITEDITTTLPDKDTPALAKKVGRTTYIVRVHFSKTSKEIMSDKIKRMLENEIKQIQKSDNENRPGFRNALAPGL